MPKSTHAVDFPSAILKFFEKNGNDIGIFLWTIVIKRACPLWFGETVQVEALVADVIFPEQTSHVIFE